MNHIKAGSLEVAGAERNKVFVKPGRVDDRQPFNARAAQSSFGSEASGDSRDPPQTGAQTLHQCAFTFRAVLVGGTCKCQT